MWDDLEVAGMEAGVVLLLWLGPGRGAKALAGEWGWREENRPARVPESWVLGIQ